MSAPILVGRRLTHLVVQPNFSGTDISWDPLAEYVYLPVPYDLWRDGAKSFGDFRQNVHTNILRPFRRMLELLIYCAKNSRFVRDTKAVFTVSLVHNSNDEPVMVLFFLRYLNKSPGGTQLSGVIHKLCEAGKRMESEAHRGPMVCRMDKEAEMKAEQVIAAMSRPEGAPASNPLSKIPHMRTVSQREKPFWQKITLESWRDIIQAVNMRQPSPSISVEEMQNVNNFYYPKKSLSINNACMKAKALKARSVYTKTKSFFQLEHGQRIGFLFPRGGKFTWKIRISDLDPQGFFDNYFPWVPRPSNLLNREQLLFMQAAKVCYLNNDEVVEDFEAAELNDLFKSDSIPIMNETQRAFFFRNMIERTASEDSLITFKKMREINTKHNFDLKAKYGNKPDVMREKREELQLKQIKEFFDILWNEEAEVPKSYRSIITWMNDYLRKHNNFCMVRKKATANLSRFGDMIASLGAQMEAGFRIATAHSEIVCIIAACFQLYSGTTFHANIAALGEAESGKSHALKWVYDAFIRGTVSMISTKTAKANTGISDEADQMIEVMEECPPEVLGVERHGKQGTTADVGVALLKGRLSTGMVKIQYPMTDKLTGQRIMVVQEVESNCILLAAANITKEMMESALATRFLVMNWTNKQRTDIDGIFSLMGSTMPTLALDLLRMRIQRNQALSALIFRLIYCKIFEDIDMTIAHLFLNQVLKKAGQRRVKGAAFIRMYEKPIFICQALVIMDAIDKVFDLPEGPLHNQDWRKEHIRLVEKHLRCEMKHIVLAVGLCEKQWDDQIQASMAKHIVKKILDMCPEEQQLADIQKILTDKHIEVNQLRDSMDDDNKQQILDLQAGEDIVEHYEAKRNAAEKVVDDMVKDKKSHKRRCRATFDSRINSWVMDKNFSSNFSNCSSEAECVAKMAKLIYNGIMPRPAEDHIKRQLHEWMDETNSVREELSVPGLHFHLHNRTTQKTIPFPEVADKDDSKQSNKKKNKPNTKQRRLDDYGKDNNPPQYIHDWTVTINSDILKQENESEISNIQACVKEVLNYKGSPICTYLYGVTKPAAPYIWETFIINPPPTVGPLIVRDANYFPEEILDLMENSIEGLKEFKRDTKNGINYRETFASKKWRCITGDLDEFSTSEHNARLYLDTEAGFLKAGEWPSNYKDVFEKQLKLADPTVTDRVYPKSFIRGSQGNATLLLDSSVNRNDTVDIKDVIAQAQKISSTKKREIDLYNSTHIQPHVEMPDLDREEVEFQRFEEEIDENVSGDDEDGNSDDDDEKSGNVSSQASESILSGTVARSSSSEAVHYSERVIENVLREFGLAETDSDNDDNEDREEEKEESEEEEDRPSVTTQYKRMCAQSMLLGKRVRVQ